MKNVNEYMDQYPILHFFGYKHLPEHLQDISKPFHELAWDMVVNLKKSAYPEEVSAGLRKLLEAKDCLVRAALPQTKKA